MKIFNFNSERTQTIGGQIQNSKAPEGWRSPKRFARNGQTAQRASVLECGGPPPLSRRAAMTVMISFLAFVAAAETTTNTLSDAEIQGRQLAQQLCDAGPVADLKNTGVLQIRTSNGNRTNLTFHGQVTITKQGWQSFYYVDLKSTPVPDSISLEIDHSQNRPNEYIFTDSGACLGVPVKDNKTAIPFADSDFWLCDLGLEFFHWPAQKVLPKPTNLVRGRDYTLLESTNPSTNGYSRVLSWIDRETGGILQAEAYDASGRLLKEFAPKSFKKVNGQWELQEMEIRNVQTGSRTRLEFDLNKQ
jgi:hypothetical protein